MYKILLNITRPHVNQVFFKDCGVTLTRTNPIAQVNAITKDLEFALKLGKIIDVLGNIPVDIDEKIRKENDRILYDLKLKTYNKKESVAANNVATDMEVKENGVQEKKEEKEVVKKDTVKDDAPASDETKKKTKKTKKEEK